LPFNGIEDWIRLHPSAVQALRVPPITLDDPDELAGVIFGAIDIHDGDVGRSRNVIDRAAEPVLDVSIAASSPHRKPFGKNL
jgi:hypothetical protein